MSTKKVKQKKNPIGRPEKADRGKIKVKALVYPTKDEFEKLGPAKIREICEPEITKAYNKVINQS